MVEKQDMDSCSVLGGQLMILTGQNFSSDSKVIFLEKSSGECLQSASCLLPPEQPVGKKSNCKLKHQFFKAFRDINCL